MTMTVATLLDAWESGREAWPGERALHLLEVGEPSATLEALAGWTVGRRDAALLHLRERLFGPTLPALAECPGCGEPLEMEFPVRSLLDGAAGAPDAAGPRPGDTDSGPDGVFWLDADGHRVRYRLPTAGDLAGLRWAEGDVSRWLLERCVIDADDVGGAQVWEALEAALARDIARHDPDAEIVLSLACPECGCQWSTTLDVVGFLWREFDAWALRVLAEVHLLAGAYGWSERDILGLSDWRRQHYLSLVGGER